MKFLVLALCVCAASAASFGNFGSAYKANKYNPAYNTAQAAAQVVASPFVAAGAAAAPFVAKAVPVAVAPAVAVAQVATKGAYKTESDAQVLRADSEINPDSYRYSYETENGISAESSAVLKNVGEEAVLVAQGGYRYTAPDGTPVVITYVADENGFQPQGDVLPVAPAIPEAIARSLAYIAARSQ